MLMRRIKIFAGISISVLLGVIYILFPEKTITLTNPQKVVWNKPTTDNEWAEDVKEEGLNVKFDYQLDEMKESLSERLVRILKEYEKYTECPRCVMWNIKKELEEIDFSGDVTAEINVRYQEQFDQIIWKMEKLKQSIERIDNEKRLRISGLNRTEDILSAKMSTEREKEEYKKLQEKIQ